MEHGSLYNELVIITLQQDFLVGEGPDRHDYLKVCEVLMKHEYLMFDQLLDESGLVKERLRKALIFLTSHMLVGFCELNHKANDFTIYSLQTETVIARLYIPQILRFASQRYGLNGVETLRTVIGHGRLSKTRILQLQEKSTSNIINQFIDEGIVISAQEENEHSCQKLFGLFCENYASVTRKGRPGKRKLESSQPEKGGPELKRARNRSSSIDFCLNYSYFLNEFSKDDCIRYIAESYGLLASYLFQTVWSLCESGTDKRSYVVLNKIFNEITVTPRNVVKSPVMSPDRLRTLLKGVTVDQAQTILQIMCQGPLPPLLTAKIPGADFQVCVNHSNVFEGLRTQIVTDYVKERFGSYGCRIFNFLLSYGTQLCEEKHISKMTMIGDKEARAKLFQMYKEGLLKLVEIPKGQEYAPQRTFYLFGVDHQKMVESTRHRFCQLLLNAKIRRVETEDKIEEERFAIAALHILDVLFVLFDWVDLFPKGRLIK